ncbi:MAG: hemerythrin domain-containing protein [Rhodospirillales bacterium]
MRELSEVGQLLHEEHFRFLVAICGLQNRIGDEFRDHPLDPRIAEDRDQLDALIAGLDDIIDHHRFEEVNLFPLIGAVGDVDLVSVLLGEHGTIEPKANRLRAIASALRRNGATHGRWSRFRIATEDLIADMMAHLEKEELRVVQRLASLLDAETDHALARGRVGKRRGGGPPPP